MNQIQGTSSLTSPDLPMKRKRGRPRKDENLVHAESIPAIPGPDSSKKNKQSAGTNDDVEDEMVGRVVSGVIEGSFDAGYLLNVKIEDTDTQLRGVVFLPGKFTPVTAANDVAPNVKMCKRKEVPIPAVNQKSHLYGSAPARPPAQSNSQPVEVKQVPAVPDQIPSLIPGIPEFRSQSFSGIPETLTQRLSESLRSQSFSGLPESVRSQPSSFLIPPVDNLPKNNAPTLGGKVISQQPLDLGPDNQSTHVMTKSENDEVGEHEKVLEEVEPATTITEPNGVEDTKESKTETSSEPAGDVLGIETVCKDPPTQPQAVGSESSVLVQDDVKSLNFELSRTPVFAEAAPAMTIIARVETVCVAPHIQPQTVDTGKSRLIDDELKSVNVELDHTPVFAEPAPSSVMLQGVETICKSLDEKNELVQDVVKSLDLELNQTPLVAEPAFTANKPVEDLMEEEAAPKASQVLGGEDVASVGPLPSVMGEPPSGAVDYMECDIADTIPPAQS